MPVPSKNNPPTEAPAPITKIEKSIEKPVKAAARYLRIDEARQKKVMDEIAEHATPDTTFVLLTVFSALIIALGLLVDNAAVVIGGMIIAPLFWPMLALAIAIIKGNAKAFRRNLVLILAFSVVVVFVSWLVGFIAPDLGPSHEIILRTKPTLFELFIALAAGFIGTYAVAHPRLSANLAGVVAAIAVVPPLGVMGILFAHGDFSEAMGAALLFATNFIAITFAAVILFLSVGVKFPRSPNNKNIAASSLSWFVIFLVIVTIPLTLVMRGIIDENVKQSTVRDVVEEYLVNSEISDLSVTVNPTVTVIRATIRSPYDVTSLHVRRLSDILTAELNTPVNLTINVVPTYQAGIVTNGISGL